MVGGGRPNLMLAQVQVFCPGPGPGQDLTGTGPGMGPGMGPGPELDNFFVYSSTVGSSLFVRTSKYLF